MRSRLKIYKLNGVEIPLSAYGLLGLELIVEAPSYSVTKEFVEGRNGQISLGKTLNPRNLIARFKVDASDFSDSLLLRDELFAIFNGSEKFYISEAKQPDKRWLVESVEPWTPERFNFRTSTIDLPLVCDEGLAESVTNYSYTHASPNFTIYNAGNVAIDPRFMDLKITFNAYAHEGFELKNNTTGDIYQYYRALFMDDEELKIEGARSTVGGLSVFRHTNKKLITLAPGENHFEVSGTVYFRISFDFRFKYL